MTEDKITIYIDDVPYDATNSENVLQVALKNHINIPHLCYLEEVNKSGNCRLCMVETQNNEMKAACKLKVQEGLKIYTKSQELYQSVTANLELLSANHNFECHYCAREFDCEFLDLLREYSISDRYTNIYKNTQHQQRIISLEAFEVDTSKCVFCGRCTSQCKNETGLSILKFNDNGLMTYVGPSMSSELENYGCISCGKCLLACPTGALAEIDHIKAFENALHDPNKRVVVQIAPSVRTSIGESFGFDYGTNIEGKLYKALELLGVDEVMDTIFAADLTIMEEAKEFKKRLETNEKIPMFTSCSPGWVNYLELYYPEMIPHLSSCKSPQQMGGAVIKTYYAQEKQLDPKQIVSVAIMPCIAKKSEASRPHMGRDGYQDVDLVLTAREFVHLLQRKRIDFANLEDIKPYGDLASYTGAGAIFGTSGGVMQAMLRTYAAWVEGEDFEIDFSDLKGFSDIKEASYIIGGRTFNVAVVQGGKAIKKCLDSIKKGLKHYDVVEFMGCKGGCVNGGGQPIVHSSKLMTDEDIIRARSQVLYQIDQKATYRKCHQNPSIIKLYDTYLNTLSDHQLHDLLHTEFLNRGKKDN